MKFAVFEYVTKMLTQELNFDVIPKINDLDETHLFTKLVADKRAEITKATSFFLIMKFLHNMGIYH